jgi:hypothetical protein
MLDEHKARFLLSAFPRNHPLFDPEDLGVPNKQRYWELLYSPDLMGKIAYACAQEGSMPPACLGEPWIVRFYTYLTQENTFFRDDVAEHVESLQLTTDMYPVILKAYLLATELSFDKVADLTRIPLDVINGFYDLFFNVRGRLNEPLFVSRNLYPHGRRKEFDKAYKKEEDWKLILLRCAFHKDFDAFYYFLGARKRPPEMGLESAVQLVENMIMTNAVVAGDHLGGLQQRDNTGFNNAKALISSSKIGGSKSEGGSADPLLGGEDVSSSIVDDLFSL